MKNIFRSVIFLLFITTNSFAQQSYCSITISPMDTTICIGDSVLITSVSNLVNSSQTFDFNSSSLPSGWTTAGGTAFGTPCGPNPSGTPYYWASTTTSGFPMITTANYDISCGGFINFDMVYAVQAGTSPCEGPDEADEGVTLQYSLDGGATWINILYYSPGGYTLPTNPNTNNGVVGAGQTAYTSWNTFTVPIPTGALSSSTKFRWIQFQPTASCCDNWGLDNIIINSTGTPCGSTTVVNWSNGMMDTESFWVVPTGDTTFSAMVYDTLGNYQCQSGLVEINVYPNQMTYNLIDTVYGYCPTFEPTVGVTDITNSIPPYSVAWSVPSTNNPTVLPTSGLEHDTLVYYVTVSDGCNYQREDSVVFIINQTLAVDTIYMGPATCDPTGWVSVGIVGQTTTPGNGVLYNWSGPGANNPNFINASVWTDLSSGWYYINVQDAVCEVNDSVFVDILNPPIADLSATPEMGCSPLEVVFSNASQNATSFSWDFGNGQTLTTTTTDSQTQTYTTSADIRLIASQGNCADTAYATIYINVCGCTDPVAINYDPLATLDDGSCIPPVPTVIVSNVFSPNNDGANDQFYLTATNALNIELIITNRWGNVVFEGSGINPAWNGKTPNGNEAADGVYFYKYVLIGYQDAVLEGHGFLHLTR